eukprot:754045-Hanusia_phi.AAC.1
MGVVRCFESRPRGYYYLGWEHPLYPGSRRGGGLQEVDLGRGGGGHAKSNRTGGIAELAWGGRRALKG